MKSGRDWSSDVGDVGKHPSSDAARDLSDAFEVDRARICRRATDEQLRSMLFSDFLQLVVVDLFSLLRNAVISDLVTEPGEIQWMTMRQVPAVREIHSQNLIAVLNRCHVNGHVCLRAAVRL